MSKKLAWIYPDQAKSRKAIGVPLGSVAITVLRRRLGQNPKYVFTYDGHPVTDVTTKAWYKALSRADIQPGSVGTIFDTLGLRGECGPSVGSELWHKFVTQKNKVDGK